MEPIRILVYQQRPAARRTGWFQEPKERGIVERKTGAGEGMEIGRSLSSRGAKRRCAVSPAKPQFPYEVEPPGGWPTSGSLDTHPPSPLPGPSRPCAVYEPTRGGPWVSFSLLLHVAGLAGWQAGPSGGPHLHRRGSPQGRLIEGPTVPRNESLAVGSVGSVDDGRRRARPPLARCALRQRWSLLGPSQND